jgi:hypothetical protein
MEGCFDLPGLWHRGDVPRRSKPQLAPCDYTVGEFLDGVVVGDPPPGVTEMVIVAQALRTALDEQETTIVELAETAGVDRSLIHDVLAGRKYLNVVSLARLEHALGRPLWPSY